MGLSTGIGRKAGCPHYTGNFSLLKRTQVTPWPPQELQTAGRRPQVCCIGAARPGWHPRGHWQRHFGLQSERAGRQEAPRACRGPAGGAPASSEGQPEIPDPQRGRQFGLSAFAGLQQCRQPPRPGSGLGQLHHRGQEKAAAAPHVKPSGAGLVAIAVVYQAGKILRRLPVEPVFL